jgi:Acetyltransferase (GNAT) domain
MDDLPALKGSRVTLRRPQDGDAEARWSLGRHAEVARMFGVGQDDVTPLTSGEAESWVTELRQHPYAWMIEFKSLIGSIRLDRVDLWGATCFACRRDSKSELARSGVRDRVQHARAGFRIQYPTAAQGLGEGARLQ